MRRNKKGSIDDLIYIIIIIIFVGFFTLIGFKVMDGFNDAVQGSNSFNTQSKNVVNAVNSKFPGVIDNTFLFLTIGMCIVAIALALLVRFHPIFFIFYIIFVPVIIFIAGAFSNLYQTAAANATLSSVANEMVFMSHIIQYLPIIIGTFGFVLAVIMYNTWRSSA